MPANKFVLTGSGVEVDYTIGANAVIPALVYTDGAFQKKFKPNEILTDDTGLGELVSVALIFTIDTGGERFGFFLPFIDVPRDIGAKLFARMDEVIGSLNAIPRGSVLWESLTASWLVLHIEDWRFQYKIEPDTNKILVLTAARHQADGPA